MTDPKPKYIPCSAPGCHSLSFVVISEDRASLAHVCCANCNRELLAVTLAPPDESRVPVI